MRASRSNRRRPTTRVGAGRVVDVPGVSRRRSGAPAAEGGAGD
jgi:hypothetical protein